MRSGGVVTVSRIAASSERATGPVRSRVDVQVLPGPRNGHLPPAARSGESSVERTREAPATHSRGDRTPGLRVVLIHPNPSATRESQESLTRAGFHEVTVAASADEAGVNADPDSRTVVAAIAVAAPEDAAVDLTTLRHRGWHRVVALLAEPDAATTTAALRHGATSAVWAGGTPPAPDHFPSGVYDLSGREVEVLRMVADGRANKWIGEQLDLSALTVKSHLARIGRKLGTGERAHMVMLALRAGIIG